MEKLFVQYPNFRSSTYKYDPCVINKSTLRCLDCRIQIISDRFLGKDFMLNIMKGRLKYPYVLIADTVGCNMRCWFCYSWHFWSRETAEEQGCKPVFVSSDGLANEFFCKFKLMSNKENMLNALREKGFLTSGEMNQSLSHISKNFPVIRIRISGGEPIFASKETLQPFESDKSIDYSLGVKYWLNFFESFDKKVVELKNKGLINMVPQEDWNFDKPWLSVITRREDRMNIRFDTNGIAFADPKLSEQFVKGIFKLHEEGKLDNSEIMIDYSFKGATPTEFRWSQNIGLPVDPSKNDYNFKLEDHPQIPGLLNLKMQVEECIKKDPKFNNCLYISVEKGIEHGRAGKHFVNYKGAMNWDSLAKKLNITFSPVSNEIDVANPWRWEAQMKRYMKPHAHAKVIAYADGKSCDSSVAGINQVISFIWEHNKKPDFKVEIMPSEKIEKTKIASKKVRKKHVKRNQKTIELFAEKPLGYIFSGSPINWKVALKKNIWGLRDSHREIWLTIKKGDPVFFYVTSPVSGLIGYGLVTQTFEGNEPYWPDEIKEGCVKYPCRVSFKLIKMLDQNLWETKSVKISHLGPIYFRGINSIMELELVEKLENLLEFFE
jgi:hypothetical protein